MPPRKATISEFREASISEFFEKNRHILGFDSPQKSLFMIVKEALDNSLDAGEEHGILPEVKVTLEKLEGDEFNISVEDNGPGIERKQVPNVFGKLLYGSRFHSFKQSRGQQGIGITAAILYGQITTARPSHIRTRRKEDDVAYDFILGINVKENKADIHSEKPMIWDKPHGTLITIPAKGKYQVGKQSILEYMRECAVANPNATLTLVDPDGKTYEIKRVTDVLSTPAVAIKPHPLGLELGDISSMAKNTAAADLVHFLREDFNRISDKVADEILAFSGIQEKKKPSELSLQDIRKISEAFKTVKLMPPPTDCLSPLGPEFIKKGLKSVYEENHPSHYGKPVSRPITVYNGNPFSVEAGIVYGGDLPSDQQVRVVRFANKVPLLYQPGACAITKAISEMDWRQYGFDQKGGQGIPYGPAIIFVHVYGIRIPFTSESKEALANVNEITTEIGLCLRSLGRGVKSFLGKKDKRAKIYEKFRLVNTLIPEIGKKASEILGEEVPNLEAVISKIANVVFVTEEFRKSEEGVDIEMKIINYTRKNVSMNIMADPPTGDYEGPELKWEITDLEPAKEFSASFALRGRIPDYPGTNYYFTGIDPVRVQGAEPLPADFGTETVSVVESDEEGEE